MGGPAAQLVRTYPPAVRRRGPCRAPWGPATRLVSGARAARGVGCRAGLSGAPGGLGASLRRSRGDGPLSEIRRRCSAGWQSSPPASGSGPARGGPARLGRRDGAARSPADRPQVGPARPAPDDPRPRPARSLPQELGHPQS
jgi:hypothetical protein